MTRKQIIERDYEQRAELKKDFYTVRLFAHKEMGDIPISDLLDCYELDYCSYSQMSHWKMGNPDYGRWDAYTVLHKTKSYFDVYVCGILVRPFSEDEHKAYDECHFKAFPVTKRLLTFYDNRINKKESSNE